MEQTNYNNDFRQLGMTAYRHEILKEKTYDINPKRQKKNFFPSPVKLRNIDPQRVYNKRIREEDLELLDTSSDEEKEDEDSDKENIVVNDDPNRKFKRMRYARDGEIYMFTYNKVGYGKEAKYTCAYKGCEFYANNQSTVAQHFSTHHGLNQAVRCQECKQEFRTKSAWQAHYARDHLQTKYPCPDSTCDKVFRSKASQYVHYAKDHLQKKYSNVHLFHDDPFFLKKHVCLVCRRRFQSRQSCFYHCSACHPMSALSLGTKYRTKSC